MGNKKSPHSLLKSTAWKICKLRARLSHVGVEIPGKGTRQRDLAKFYIHGQKNPQQSDKCDTVKDAQRKAGVWGWDGSCARGKLSGKRREGDEARETWTLSEPPFPAPLSPFSLSAELMTHCWNEREPRGEVLWGVEIHRSSTAVAQAAAW